MKSRKFKYRTDFLLPKNNFWVGLGSVLNLAGSYFDYNYSMTENEADYRALKSDWENVGEDIMLSEQKFNITIKDRLVLK